MSKNVIVVIGMHRSGTSLLSRVLASAGIPLGDNLRNEYNDDNTEGYWEHAEIVGIQNDLVHYLGCDWNGKYAGKPLPTNWLSFSETIKTKNKLKSIVEKEIAKSNLWAFKDPRTCRFLPIWKSIFEELAINPSYILAIRNPASSIASLVKRDSIDYTLAENIWKITNKEILENINTKHIIDYDDWFLNVNNTIVLNNFLRTFNKSVGNINFIKHHLRHHVDDKIPIKKSTYNLYEEIKKLRTI